ncbi:HK97-gp10 family putative phage morphogenesis protein [Heyndrickxia ginsengihumi]|uniref:HK97-gp10 family putative phage morphogenesis protein n=1 Tax=Heyndrickxia ginsengihumi TaxID=363870 RepID=UPI00046F17C5|nr:HK97-gp10 family putative phage morphogenesis protein [Heyndrickxia ginsengihumi]
MGVEIDTSSIDKALKQMAGKEKRVRNRALKQGANTLAARLRENTPVDDNDNNEKHMRDGIVVSGVNADGEIQVGYDKETYWRVHFSELGTIKQRPQGFIQRTEEEMKNEFFKTVQDELKKGLGL